jgi:hypothetical protein
MIVNRPSIEKHYFSPDNESNKQLINNPSSNTIDHDIRNILNDYKTNNNSQNGKFNSLRNSASVGNLNSNIVYSCRRDRLGRSNKLRSSS